MLRLETRVGEIEMNRRTRAMSSASDGVGVRPDRCRRRSSSSVDNAHTHTIYIIIPRPNDTPSTNNTGTTTTTSPIAARRRILAQSSLARTRNPEPPSHRPSHPPPASLPHSSGCACTAFSWSTGRRRGGSGGARPPLKETRRDVTARYGSDVMW